MVRCDNCAIDVEDGVKYCPLCGKDLAEINQLPVSDEDRCNALLNIAVEHRLSKEWDEAVSFAVKALKANPQSAKAASTLALIYEERGLFDEASVWYRTVLEIEPGNQEASSSLYRVKRRIAGRSGADRKNPVVSFIEDHKILIIASLTTIVIITMVMSLVTSKKKPQEPIVITPLPQQSSSDSTQQPTPLATMPGDNQASTSQEPQSLQQPIPQAPVLSHTTVEQNLQSSMANSQELANYSIDVKDVIIDPRQPLSAITFTLPAQTSSNRSNVIAASASVVMEAFSGNTELKYVTVRCLTSLNNSSSYQIVFVGDVSRENYDSLGSNITQEQLAGLFANAWWNPQIR